MSFATRQRAWTAVSCRARDGPGRRRGLVERFHVWLWVSCSAPTKYRLRRLDRTLISVVPVPNGQDLDTHLAGRASLDENISGTYNARFFPEARATGTPLMPDIFADLPDPTCSHLNPESGIQLSQLLVLIPLRLAHLVLIPLRLARTRAHAASQREVPAIRTGGRAASAIPGGVCLTLWPGR